MLDKTILLTTLQRRAASYDAAAALARETADRLLEQLDWIRIQPLRILDIGAGTGYVTRLLAERYPVAQVIAVDISEHLLHHSQSSTAANICADAHSLPFAAATFDLIVSNLMLPWCESLAAVFMQIQQALKPNGLLLFSSLGPDTLREMRASWAAVDDMAHVHLFLDMHDVGDALLHAGFSDPIVQTEWLTFAYQRIETLLADLKNTGCGNVLRERRNTLTGKQRFQRFLAEYANYRDENKNLPATFEIIYGHCWKQLTPNSSSGEFRIAVDEIKYNRG